MTIQHIVPAIIPESRTHLESRLRDVRDVVTRVQVDVLDGTYAPSTSWPYNSTHGEAFETLRRQDEGLPFWQELTFEIDLMVREPEKHIEAWALAGASSIIIHLDSTEKLVEAIRRCGEHRLEVALAVCPATDIDMLEPFIDIALFVQVMGSDKIGYHGVALDDAAIERIRTIHERWPDVLIGVDIGVNEETIPTLIEAGARRFAIGSAIFNYSAPAGAVSHLQTIVDQHLPQ
jgi:ribulose-phosphate 3-epimerase